MCRPHNNFIVQDKDDREGHDSDVEISVVIPVYKCANSLRPLYHRLSVLFEKLSQSYEVIFVDDRSPDDAWQQLHRLTQEFPQINAIRLDRNYGQHTAVAAGLAESRGRWAVVMDGDLQDAPEDIERLYRKAQAGADIVFSEYATPRQYPWFRRIVRWCFCCLMKWLSGGKWTGQLGMFSMLSRRAINLYLRQPERTKAYIALLCHLDLQMATVPCEKGFRTSGRSSYSFIKLTGFGMRVFRIHLCRFLKLQRNVSGSETADLESSVNYRIAHRL